MQSPPKCFFENCFTGVFFPFSPFACRKRTAPRPPNYREANRRTISAFSTHWASLGDRKAGSLEDAASGRSPTQRCLGSTHRPGLSAEERKAQGVTRPALRGSWVLRSSPALLSPPFRASQHQEQQLLQKHSPTSLLLSAPCWLLNPPLSAWTPSAQTRRVRRTTGMKCAPGPDAPSALRARPAPTLSPSSLRGLARCRAHRRLSVSASSVKDEGELKPDKSRAFDNVREINLLNSIN